MASTTRADSSFASDTVARPWWDGGADDAPGPAIGFDAASPPHKEVRQLRQGAVGAGARVRLRPGCRPCRSAPCPSAPGADWSSGTSTGRPCPGTRPERSGPRPARGSGARPPRIGLAHIASGTGDVGPDVDHQDVAHQRFTPGSGSRTVVGGAVSKEAEADAEHPDVLADADAGWGGPDAVRLVQGGVRGYIAVRAAENATIVADAIPHPGGRTLPSDGDPAGCPNAAGAASTRGRRDRGWSPPTLA